MHVYLYLYVPVRAPAPSHPLFDAPAVPRGKAIPFLSFRAPMFHVFMDESKPCVQCSFAGKRGDSDEQVVILLAVEVPRAASGLPPYLLPHLWGVGVGDLEQAGVSFEGDGDGGAEANEGWITAAGEHRARLAFLLLVNGLCLYGHVLALFALLSRLSATVFAILR